MEIVIILVGIALVGVVGYLAYKLQSPKEETDQKMLFEYFESLRKEIRDSDNSTRKETQEKLDKIQDRLAKGLEHTSSTVQKQFTDSTKLIKEITQKLTQLDETNKQVLGFSEQMQSLENILKNPKQRGILGEYFLDTLLGHVLQPNQYKMQYKFSNGELVDAAIFFKNKIIPIDAKFSLEKYNKMMEEQSEDKRKTLQKEFKMDIKNRIDETAKYIRPKEDTTDFAFMFIPAEGVYYNLLIYKVGGLDVNAADLVEYAFSKKVIIVSPTSFFAYLQTVLQGLKALEIEKKAEDIMKNVEKLGKHINSHDAYMQKLGNSLGTTVNMYNSTYTEFKKIDKDVYKITDGQAGGEITPEIIEKPKIEI
ncbi:DNA recombination protein RmuC [Candidatus Peregrinibacteria bacterium]|jgi:DNA recombination protein RmuC|nr:DNA recombination protein RmuC [Candidatus Peregrinibacteria bacterium]